ncbi:MAG: 1-acyl-sn-glycerol-3-phosphate acyltransferase, partial [Anaerolineales bacterium]|nr:1-acyl-sn-glycerol-3-phosphate acyltransferase [Anaerolineales bacterium]
MCLRLDKCGLENLPKQGPALIVGNHLGDADLIVGMAISPAVNVEVLAKSELYEFPILGKVLDIYGVIWIHRGQPDRRAIQSVLLGLKEMIARFVEHRHDVVVRRTKFDLRKAEERAHILEGLL